MGLAASQARFLNLTARKTNIEYEGQQINQQRTMLANQSANCYSQMLTLTVPVPPSESNFSTVVYTFTYGGNNYTINQITGSDTNATLACTYTHTNNYDMIDVPHRIVGQIQSALNSQDKTTLQEFSDAHILSGNDILNGLRDKTGNTTLQMNDIYVVQRGYGDNVNYQYYLASEIDYQPEDAEVTGYIAGSTIIYEQRAFTGVSISRNNATNRISAIGGGELGAQDVAITATTVKDDIAYEDAYAEYEYQTYLYQQKMEEINAQTSIIQAQDKKLELRLKQLDTEQNAVSTEMDNITNLIDKSIETTFKVFA